MPEREIDVLKKNISHDSSVIGRTRTFSFRKKWQKTNLKNIYSQLTYKADIKTWSSSSQVTLVINGEKKCHLQKAVHLSHTSALKLDTSTPEIAYFSHLVKGAHVVMNWDTEVLL